MSGTDRHLDITLGLQLVESFSLVSVLFREAFSHPYISFYHLLVNGFSVIIYCIEYINHKLEHSRALDSMRFCKLAKLTHQMKLDVLAMLQLKSANDLVEHFTVFAQNLFLQVVSVAKAAN